MSVVSQGVVWSVDLTRSEVGSLTTASGLAALQLPSTISIAVAAVAGYVALIDQIGGNNGVDISGVFGLAGAIVTPRGFGAYGWLVKGANLVVDSGRTIGEFILKLVGSIQHGEIQSVAVLASIDGGLLAGLAAIPIGGAILDWLFGRQAAPPPDSPEALNKRGAVKANRPKVGPWETFVLTGVGGGKVALLSWQGFFSAQGGGGSSVYANRPWVRDWEKWELERNADDGSVSFKSEFGRYLGASMTPDNSATVIRESLEHTEGLDVST